MPTVAIGIYLRVLYALQLDDDILWLATEDKPGKILQDLRITKISENLMYQSSGYVMRQ